MSTIETSLPFVWLIIGVVSSVAFFLWLQFRESRGISPLARWTLAILRAALCLLVWFLIAQPRAITTREEVMPVTAHLGIDVSQSMSLADEWGPNTTDWKTRAKPDALNEAITLTEAARIRINLFSRRFAAGPEELKSEISQISAILQSVQKKLDALDTVPEFNRLLKTPSENLSAAMKELNEADSDNPIAALDRAAKLAGQTALTLRRIVTLRSSPKTAGDSEAIPRINLVNQWAEEMRPTFEKLTENCTLKSATFATSLTPVEKASGFAITDAEGARTHLFDNLNELAKQDISQGKKISLLVTDGVDSSGPDGGEFSASVRNQPLIVIPIGDPLTTPDVRIHSVVSPARIRDKDTFVATAEISLACSTPQKVTVTLKGNEEILATKEIQLDGDGSSKQVALEWKATGVGPRKFKVEVSPLVDEKYLNNNSEVIECIVTKDKYSVLICDSFPRWETRYLQNLFSRDPSLEMRSLVFEPNHSYPGSPPKKSQALPLDGESWRAFDLVILGDVTPLQLTPQHQEVLAEYVKSGGNLILMAGENAMPSAYVGMPLEALLPMTQVQQSPLSGSFVIAPPSRLPVNRMVDIEGENSRSLWQSIFSVTPQHRIEPWVKAKESALALLSATDQTSGKEYDFAAVQRIGAGRVAFFAAPCLYHLRFRFGDRYHTRVWGQLIRGLCADNFGFGEAHVSTRIDRRIWSEGEEVQGRVRIKSANGEPLQGADFTALLTSNGKITAEMKPAPDGSRPGEYFFRFPSLPSGEYEISYAGDDISSLLEKDRLMQPDLTMTNFTVLGAGQNEETQFSLTHSNFWSRVNELPLAATITPGTLPLMLEALHFKPERISITTKRSLWDTWQVLLVIIFIAGAEWCLRRLSGLC